MMFYKTTMGTIKWLRIYDKNKMEDRHTKDNNKYKIMNKDTRSDFTKRA